MISEPMDLETARRIAGQLIKSGKEPGTLTFAEQEAVTIVWADIEQQLEPVRSTLQAFGQAMIEIGDQFRGYARALEPAPERFVPAWPGSRPAWQRNRGRR